MRAKLALAVAVASVAAIVMFAGPSSASAAPPAVDLGSCGTNCTAQLVGFGNAGGQLSAVVAVTNTATGATRRVSAPITAQQQGGTCTILDLTIQPIDLFLLGIHVHTDTIHLVITAERGTLLGDLLCGLFFPGPSNQLVAALNEALREGAVSVAPPGVVSGAGLT